jgi:copper resistance protein C
MRPNAFLCGGTMNRTISLAALLLALVLAVPLAQAHSHLQSSDPAANATLAASPKEIRLTFNMAFEPKFSTVRLLDASGKVVETPPAAPDPQNPKLLLLQLPQALPPGAYKVEWKVVAGDAHPMTGSFSFTITQ